MIMIQVANMPRYLALLALVVASVACIATCSGAEPNQPKAAASSVEYAQLDAQQASDRFGGVVEAALAEQADKKEGSLAAPTCSCPAASVEAQTEAPEPEVSAKPSKAAKKAAKKYKVITISMPEDDEAEADAVIETRMAEEQQVVKLAQQMELAEPKGAAEADVVAPEDEELQPAEESPVKASKEKAKSKGHKKADKKAYENKRSKRDTQKRAKRDSKSTKRDKKSKRSEKAKKDRK